MIEEIFNHTSLNPLKKELKNSSLLVENLWDSSKALLLAIAARETKKNLLIITGEAKEENQLFHDLSTMHDDEIFDFPAWETLPQDQIPPSPDIVGERYELFKRLESKKPLIILSSLQAILQKVIAPEIFFNLILNIKTDDKIKFKKTIEQIAEMGYDRKPLVSDKGEFAVRGDIIDIFPVSSPEPFRIEFWADEIESIRSFDPVGQKSTGNLEEIEILPAKEMELLKEFPPLSSVTDYLGEDTIIVFDNILAIEDRALSLKPSNTFDSFDEFLKKSKHLQKLFFSENPIEELSEVKFEKSKDQNFYSQKNVMQSLSFSIFNREFQAKRWAHQLKKIEDCTVGLDGMEMLDELASQNLKFVFMSDSDAEEKKFKKDLKIGNASFHKGYLSKGFVIADDTVIFPFSEVNKKHKIRRQKLRTTFHTAPSEVFDLKKGDLVVHLNNGIGKFIEIAPKPDISGIEREFFVIEYAEKAKLYTPVTQAHLISKYIGADAKIPTMHTIGSSKWKRVREKTEKAIATYADDLLKLYAERSNAEGFAFPQDDEEMQLFEDEFPFIETEDQQQAITNIKNDMMSTKPTDHLICGDVGYGKTEVAMRAAFRAVLSGKQVAMLVPTTVLAMQHYESFIERMQNFPVKIALLSRFNSKKQTMENITGVADGSVDILIGTHRILSKDISFKDLGLVIIDEEQRFGVKSKEHLRKMKSNVDCITLSATPIPRTLYMSLMGARDMSVINTPPQDRLPIKTIICEMDEQVVKNAILRELSRDGQVYFIHNRVESIYRMAEKIRTLLPQARIIVGHGQMNSKELDTVFHAFKDGRVDILVATTIVENGLDIPNANTILIDNALNFGLADLYQLRGRVGRWNKRAYAYLLTPKNRFVPEFALERLSVLTTTSGYGGGMKIAMRDLELRGAGNILGTEQSGHIAAIGFHLYCKLLKQTIEKIKESEIKVFCDTKIELPFKAFIPSNYISEISLRMEMYHKIGEAASLEKLDEIMAEIKDRFAKHPDPLKWLYHIKKIKIFASRNSFSLLKIENQKLHAHQKHGPQTIKKEIAVGKINSPEKLEKKIIEELKENFPIIWS